MGQTVRFQETLRRLAMIDEGFGTREMRERYHGVKIPPTNLKPDFSGQAQAFANKLADSLGGARTTTEGITA